jgi:hypothetical protein
LGLGLTLAPVKTVRDPATGCLFLVFTAGGQRRWRLISPESNMRWKNWIRRMKEAK